jgi:hypothetical protein
MAELTSYDFWRNALAGVAQDIHDGHAHPGFYRKRVSRGGAFVPVAIWEQDGKLVATVDGKEIDPIEVWTFCCQHPVTEEAYRERVSTGMWPDEDSGVAASLRGPGDNNPPQDEVEAISDQIDAAAANAAAYETIADDETAARAQSSRSRLLELGGQADKRREVLKRPHLEAGKAVDAAWQPLVQKAKGAADAIRRALGAYETRKAQEAERQRQEQERLRREAEAAARKAETAGKPAPPPPPPPDPEPPAPQTQVRGAYGRAASIKEVKRATVANQDEAYGFLKGHKELKDFIAKLAQRAVDAGYEVPGVTVTIERVVR